MNRLTNHPKSPIFMITLLQIHVIILLIYHDNFTSNTYIITILLMIHHSLDYSTSIHHYHYYYTTDASFTFVAFMYFLICVATKSFPVSITTIAAIITTSR